MGISESFKKMMYMSIGALVITEEKANELISDLVKKGELSREEGRKSMEELKGKLKENQREMKAWIERTARGAVKKTGVVPRDEFDELKQKVEELERRLRTHDHGESAPEAPGGPESPESSEDESAPAGEESPAPEED